MKDLEAVMHDADDRMRRGERDGEAVGRWLTKFKSIAHDVKDVLDELDANQLIRKTESKVLTPTPFSYKTLRLQIKLQTHLIILTF